MKTQRKAFILSLALTVLLTGCNSANVDSEIKIPIYDDGGITYETYTVERQDLYTESAISASIGYPYSQEITINVSGTLSENKTVLYSEVKEGDVLATVEATDANYEYNNQKAIADNAYATYSANATEANKVNYELEKAKLDRLEYELSKYTVTAPYDGVIINVGRMSNGTTLNGGESLCTIAKTDEVYVYCNDSKLFKLGMSVKIKVNDIEYKGTVVMCGESAPTSNSHTQAVINFDDGELAKVLKDTPNAISAGWATVYVPEVCRYNIIAVPSNAVKDRSDSIYCNVLINNKKVQVPVEVGETYGETTEILSGLHEGDLVIPE